MTHQTDIVIIGAGPVGLFTIFQCGMLGMKTHSVDSLDNIGGQCTALYPEKPIYDIPAFASISGADLIDNLAKQAEAFSPIYHLSQTVTHIAGDSDTGFTVTTSKNIQISCKAIIIAGGAGSFGPNRPPLKDLDLYEGKSIFYSVKKRGDFAGKKIVIAGGGDSAVDWALSLSEIAQTLYIVHRRDNFRAAPASLRRMRDLVVQNRIRWVVPSQLHGLKGDGKNLSHVIIRRDDSATEELEADILLPFYGLSTTLGAISDWGLDLNHNHIVINPVTAQTNISGIYAVGDIATYEKKLKLILTGFSESAGAAHHAYSIVFYNKALHFEYSTSKGVNTVNT